MIALYLSTFPLQQSLMVLSSYSSSTTGMLSHQRIKLSKLCKNLYSSTSTSWRQRGLKSVPRSDLDELIHRAFLPACAGTILVCIR